MLLKSDHILQTSSNKQYKSLIPYVNIIYGPINFALFLVRCSDEWPTVETMDPQTGFPHVSHPSRTFYYTFISIVLYFFPILVMSFAYCFIIMKLSRRPPGEYVDAEACVQIKVKRKVKSNNSFHKCFNTFPALIKSGLYGPT